MNFDDNQPSDGRLSDQGVTPDAVSASAWDRREFEMALPLYVGGDLNGEDALRLELWLEIHPEDRTLLDAAQASASVLTAHTARQRERQSPDLWPAIRAELGASGLIAGTATAHKSAPAELAPILGGPSWFQRKSVAAAAAILLMGSIGVSLMLHSSDVGSPAGNEGVPVDALGIVAAELGTPGGVIDADGSVPTRFGPAISGTGDSPLDVRAVGSRLAPVAASAGRGQPLRQMEPGASRLIDEAPNVLLWQADPSGQAFRSLDTLVVPSSAQLTSGGQ